MSEKSKRKLAKNMAEFGNACSKYILGVLKPQWRQHKHIDGALVTEEAKESNGANKIYKYGW